MNSQTLVCRRLGSFIFGRVSVLEFIELSLSCCKQCNQSVFVGNFSLRQVRFKAVVSSRIVVFL